MFYSRDASESWNIWTCLSTGSLFWCRSSLFPLNPALFGVFSTGWLPDWNLFIIFFACLILHDQLNALSSQGGFSRDVSYVQRPAMSSGIKHLHPKCFPVKALSFMGTVFPSRPLYAFCFSTTCHSKLASVPNRRISCTNSMASVRTSPCTLFGICVFLLQLISCNGKWIWFPRSMVTLYGIS